MASRMRLSRASRCAVICCLASAQGGRVADGAVYDLGGTPGAAPHRGVRRDAVEARVAHAEHPENEVPNGLPARAGGVRDAVQDAVDVDALQPDGVSSGLASSPVSCTAPSRAVQARTTRSTSVLSWPGTMERMKPVFSATTLRAVRSR